AGVTAQCRGPDTEPASRALCPGVVMEIRRWVLGGRRRINANAYDHCRAVFACPGAQGIQGFVGPGACIVTIEPTGSEGEEPIERTLQEGLARAPLTDEAYARMHAAVAAEWQTVVQSRPRPPPRRWIAVASGLAAALIVASVVLGVFSKTQPLGRIARPLELRATLSVGKVLATRSPVLVELRDGGSLRIAPGAELEVTGADEVFLRKGELYM